MRDNKNLNNVWFLIILLLFCIAFATYYTMSFGKNPMLSINNVETDESKSLKDYYQVPLPNGIVGDLKEDKVYQIDNTFVANYIKRFANIQIADGNLDYTLDVNKTDYLVPSSELEDIAGNYFNVDLTETNLNYDQASEQYLITKQLASNAEYYVIKVVKTDDIYVITYHEYKKAYYNGDLNNQSRLFKAAKYEFGIEKINDDFVAKTYRVKYYYDLPEGYQVVN